MASADEAQRHQMEAAERYAFSRLGFVRVVVDSGVADSGSANTLIDHTKNWGANANSFVGATIIIIGGPSEGSSGQIISDIGSTITLLGNWGNGPVGAGSKYVIVPMSGFQYNGIPAVMDAPNIDNRGGNNSLYTSNQNTIFNGTNWDRLRSNVNLQNVSDVTTATYTGPDILTYNAKSLLVVIDCTTLTGVGATYSPEVDWKDGAGNYPVLWKQGTAKTATARTLILIGPGVAPAPIIAAGTGDSATASVDSATAAELIQIPFPVPNTIRIKITKALAATFTANLQVQGS